jgi:protocatechuate 3,4-dioxygenase beta subunit
MIRRPTRRDLLRAAALAAGGLGFAETALAQQGLRPTPQCKDGDDDPTAAQTEGPFYKPNSPQRADLREPGFGGRPVVLTGVVLTRRCKPISRALVDLWHADDKGNYDDQGFRYRGHVLTDAEGRYEFHTIMPALYPGRTRHYHVKVLVPSRALLTTQLYFPNEPANLRDNLFKRALQMRVADSGGELAAQFAFVLDLS